MWPKLKSFLFSNNNTRQTVAKNAFWLTVSNVGGRLMRALIIIYAARVLGADPWGVFSYVITLVTFLTMFTDLGVSRILIRETAKTPDPKERSAILSTTFFMSAALLALGVLVILLIGPHISTLDGAAKLLPIAAFILIFDTLREFGFSVTRAMEKMEWEAGLYLFTNLAIVSSGFILLQYRRTAFAFIFAYALGTGLGMLVTFIVLRHHFRDIFNSFAPRLIRPVLTAAWPFAIAGILGGLMINTDILLLGFFRTAAEVGFYSAADRITQLLYLLPAILSTSILPVLSRIAREDAKRTRTLLEQINTIVLLVSIPVAIGGLILAPQIIRLVFGSGFLAASAPLQILLITLVFDFPGVIWTTAVFAHDRQKALITFTALGGGINVLLDLILIPRFGMLGSAYATLAAQIISNFYLWRVMRRLTYFEIFPHLKRIFVATVLMTATTFGLLWLSVPTLLIICLSALIYFAVLFVLKEPLIQEVKMILRVGELPA